MYGLVLIDLFVRIDIFILLEDNRANLKVE